MSIPTDSTLHAAVRVSSVLPIGTRLPGPQGCRAALLTAALKDAAGAGDYAQVVSVMRDGAELCSKTKQK